MAGRRYPWTNALTFGDIHYFSGIPQKYPRVQYNCRGFFRGWSGVVDLYKVTGMFLQALGGFLIVLVAALVTLALQFGIGFTLTHGLTLVIAVGMVALGRVTEKWGQR